jgi:UDPglucose 6-dehydrogenase
MRIAVVGSGYVGLVTGACFAELGHEVVLVDNDQEKLAELRAGNVPIHERFLDEILARQRGTRMQFSGDLQGAVRQSDAIFIAVGTPPTDRGDADMSYVESVAREIAGAVDSYKVVVEKSTVPVYTSQWIRTVIIRNGASPTSFDIASNPEFLREGSAVSDFLYPDRIVVGLDSERCAEVLRQIYAPLTSGEYYERGDAIPCPSQSQEPPRLILTSTRSAELIKHASNAFLAMKISFINAVASICESVGANVQQVCDGVGADSRIGPRFLNPGIGYGGSCFPKDLLAFRAVAKECGYDFRLLDEVIRINEDQRHRFLRKVRSVLWTLRGKRLGVLGLAFKGGTDDIRESPAIALVQELLREGCHICAYDPAAIERAREILPSMVEYADGPYEAAAHADALLILTEWEEFACLDLARLRKQLKYPIILDGRNLYDPESMSACGFSYYSVGRPAALTDVGAVGAEPARRQVS